MSVDGDSEEVSGVVYDARLFYYKQWAQLSSALKVAMINGELLVWYRVSVSIYNTVRPFIDSAVCERVERNLVRARAEVVRYSNAGPGVDGRLVKAQAFAEAEELLLGVERDLIEGMAEQNMLLPRSAGEQSFDLNALERRGG